MELKIITKKSDFNDIINNNEYVIVYCGLTFCAPCNKIYPVYEDLVNQHSNITFCKIILDTLDPTQDQQCASDVNSDGEIDVIDIVTLVNYILE